MSLAVRSIVFICSVVILVLAVCAIGVALGWDPTITLMAISEWVLAHQTETGLGGVLAFAIAVIGLYLSLQRQSEPEGLVKETTLGTIVISQAAVETLIKRAASEIEGVRTIRPSVSNPGDKLTVKLALEVAPDTNIPQLADQVHTRVQEYLAHTVGVTDVNIDIAVREISTTLQKARVK